MEHLKDMISYAKLADDDYSEDDDLNDDDVIDFSDPDWDEE